MGNISDKDDLKIRWGLKVPPSGGAVSMPVVNRESVVPAADVDVVGERLKDTVTDPAVRVANTASFPVQSPEDTGANERVRVIAESGRDLPEPVAEPVAEPVVESQPAVPRQKQEVEAALESLVQTPVEFSIRRQGSGQQPKNTKIPESVTVSDTALKTPEMSKTPETPTSTGAPEVDTPEVVNPEYPIVEVEKKRFGFFKAGGGKKVKAEKKEKVPRVKKPRKEKVESGESGSKASGRGLRAVAALLLLGVIGFGALVFTRPDILEKQGIDVGFARDLPYVGKWVPATGSARSSGVGVPAETAGVDAFVMNLDPDSSGTDVGASNNLAPSGTVWDLVPENAFLLMDIPSTDVLLNILADPGIAGMDTSSRELVDQIRAHPFLMFIGGKLPESIAVALLDTGSIPEPVGYLEIDRGQRDALEGLFSGNAQAWRRIELIAEKGAISFYKSTKEMGSGPLRGTVIVGFVSNYLVFARNETTARQLVDLTTRSQLARSYVASPRFEVENMPKGQFNIWLDIPATVRVINRFSGFFLKGAPEGVQAVYEDMVQVMQTTRGMSISLVNGARTMSLEQRLWWKEQARQDTILGQLEVKGIDWKALEIPGFSQRTVSNVDWVGTLNRLETYLRARIPAVDRFVESMDQRVISRMGVNLRQSIMENLGTRSFNLTTGDGNDSVIGVEAADPQKIIMQLSAYIIMQLGEENVSISRETYAGVPILRIGSTAPDTPVSVSLAPWNNHVLAGIQKSGMYDPVQWFLYNAPQAVENSRVTQQVGMLADLNQALSVGMFTPAVLVKEMQKNQADSAQSARINAAANMLQWIPDNLKIITLVSADPEGLTSEWILLKR